jgi:hypothetical protein
MSIGKLKTGIDKYANKLQFSHFNCATAKTITTAEQWNAAADCNVVITPTVADAYVTVAVSAVTPVGTGSGFFLGKFIPLGSSYTTTIRAGEYIGSTAAVNVVDLGEL